MNHGNVIVLINGPFGVGKSTTADRVVRIIPKSAVFDPEEIGSFLRRVLGCLDTPADYQDLALWRSLTVDIASRIQAAYGCNLVMQ